MSQNNEENLFYCTVGITLLMCALTCGIYFGTNPTSGIQTLSALILMLVFSLIGGYLASHGYIMSNTQTGENSSSS